MDSLIAALLPQSQTLLLNSQNWFLVVYAELLTVHRIHFYFLLLIDAVEKTH